MATEAATPATQPSLSPTQATTYLTQFIGRNLRIHDRNIILALTHEYRPPSDAAIRAAIRSSGDPAVQLPLSSRYVGLVVVPGRYVTKIEYEESPWAPAPVLASPTAVV
ncbi:lsm domain-containing protein [Botryosphaeria dothidea]|uniref:Lsm domain-containing protein n=1 Tax=Botryosphaeria dothidea TaxID=55169 RepID=A0A8H4N542_9PEZI|nr:lsm domain-containing protein [Botryosphaeria dothidea]